MMDDRIRGKLDAIEARLVELERLLCDPATLADRTEYLRLAKERSSILDVVEAYRSWKKHAKEREEHEAALGDAELAELARAELDELRPRIEETEEKIRILLLPRDPNDGRNALLEIRSGTGGDEAALFARDLLRMYKRFAERHGWTVEEMSLSGTGEGIKEVICLLAGKDVFSHLRFEGGVHRVQRVPATESAGRIHTSAATVAVLPEADEVDVQIAESELEITVAAAGGPGGQGVNTTNSAVQIRHVPTGIIVKCQDERSQIKNKSRAMKVLRARLLEREQQAQHERIAAERRGMVGTGDRSEKVRTYNFKENRVTDHRIGVSLYRLEAILDGDLDELVTRLRTHFEAERLRGEATAT